MNWGCFFVVVQWVSADTEKIYEYLNRRWVEETGAYPADDEPMIIVMVISILAELHDQMCPHRPDPQTSTYQAQIPDQRNRGTLKVEPWAAGARAVRNRSGR